MAYNTDEFINDVVDLRKRMSEVIQQASDDGTVSAELADWLEKHADEKFERAIRWTIAQIEAYENRFAGWDERIL